RPLHSFPTRRSSDLSARSVTTGRAWGRRGISRVGRAGAPAGRAIGNTMPHSSQNFATSRLAWPQLGQIMLAILSGRTFRGWLAWQAGRGQDGTPPAAAANVRGARLFYAPARAGVLPAQAQSAEPRPCSLRTSTSHRAALLLGS